MTIVKAHTGYLPLAVICSDFGSLFLLDCVTVCKHNRRLCQVRVQSKKL